eukprot:CAMPEP_0179357600 /NCGR_PEP_ID=MMETSP0797-20121207/78492_1 /TAXON_ID=47934 /ORGANISM="Dinophysis acuminata, Strain DAEP01" /LENGTH=207 /DNA_ID=CAMNT_0021072823 /DNA_START=97 /DNA_END=716 /DNA_ORIENTATION=+
MNSAPAILMLFVGGAPSARGQFFRLQGSVQSYSGASMSSSSFMSSSSWYPGTDGQIHKQVSQVHSEMVNDGLTTERTQSKVACVDDLCRQQTLRAMRPSQSGEAPTYSYTHRAEQPTGPFVAVIVRPAPPPTFAQVVEPAPAMRDMDAVIGFLAISTLASFVGIYVFAFCVYLVSKRHGQADARERSLAGLAEPLAPSQAMETPLAP